MESIAITPTPATRPVTFSWDDASGTLVRQVRRRDGTIARSTLPCPARPAIGLEDAWDQLWLSSADAPPASDSEPVRTVDLFCGCGAMTLGAREAARALGRGFQSRLSVDIFDRALATHEANFGGRAHHGSVADLCGEVGDPVSAEEQALCDSVGPIELLMGGPPCQGNSDLNNHTRRQDPKNALYLTMARFSELLRPEHVIIENVPGVVHDKGRVVEHTRTALEALGYHVAGGVLRASDLGVPQRRRRFVLIASRTQRVTPEDVVRRHGFQRERAIGWALEDLLDHEGAAPFDTSARHSDVNRRRIDYLFDHDLHDLPNEQRPDCHRLKPHSYKAVYGRLHWDRPAPTVTTGFGSTGQGRFVHPKRRRTLTPHEAARLQFIPDFFRFPTHRRGALQTMIGNAVPPRLSYCVALELLR